MIKDLIQAAYDLTVRESEGVDEELQPKTGPAVPVGQGVPTLAPSVYQPISPQLADRFAMFGRWTTATHAHWLSLADMEAMWSEEAAAADPFLASVRESWRDGAEGWPNEASKLFRPERLSLFAGTDLDYQRIYLLWLEQEDEPEVWVYDPNGESRYPDLKAYLDAYMADDLSATERSWRA